MKTSLTSGPSASVAPHRLPRQWALPLRNASPPPQRRAGGLAENNPRCQGNRASGACALRKESAGFSSRRTCSWVFSPARSACAKCCRRVEAVACVAGAGGLAGVCVRVGWCFAGLGGAGGSRGPWRPEVVRAARQRDSWRRRAVAVGPGYNLEVR